MTEKDITGVKEMAFMIRKGIIEVLAMAFMIIMGIGVAEVVKERSNVSNKKLSLSKYD